ncbi:MAG TPA: hypothetical protein VOA41_04330, partial [Candidatus Dormibacteraeota bacterium]|nr:hypothetical protein [Candidatus Dormibacteraeota bacterium]
DFKSPAYAISPPGRCETPIFMRLFFTCDYIRFTTNQLQLVTVSAGYAGGTASMTSRARAASSSRPILYLSNIARVLCPVISKNLATIEAFSEVAMHTLWYKTAE